MLTFEEATSTVPPRARPGCILAPCPPELDQAALSDIVPLPPQDFDRRVVPAAGLDEIIVDEGVMRQLKEIVQFEKARCVWVCCTYCIFYIVSICIIYFPPSHSPSHLL